LPLVIVVVVALVAGLIWRARSTRRLTVEESVDRYRRTLGAVHDAATRAHVPDDEMRVPPREPSRQRSPQLFRVGSGRAAPLASRRSVVVIAIAVFTVVVAGVIVATTRGTPKHRTSAPTTATVRQVPRATTTTRPAATTTAPPLVRATGSVNTFTISKPRYTIAVQTTTAACWVDMRDPTGKSLFSGTLAVGASQSITAGAVTVRLGNPAAAAVSIDGTPVQFTIPIGSTVTLHFQGTAAPA
jgi:hypothetical protein